MSRWYLLSKWYKYKLYHYHIQIEIHGKYDEMWLGITWNKDFATTCCHWDILRNSKCIEYYAGLYNDESDQGHIEYAGDDIHSRLENYGTNDVIGIKVKD